MADQITLRDYRTADLDTILQLDEVCFSAEFRFDRESMRAFAERNRSVCLIAEAGQKGIVGFVIVHLEPSAKGWRGYVVTLDVAAESRCRGVARRLMLEAETRVAAGGARRMELHVFTGNEEAIRFYERLGYDRKGERKRFYGKAGLDAFEYLKVLEVM